MQKLENEYVSSGWHPDYAMTIRDSRYAFGVRYQPEKPSHDYLYVVATLTVIAVIVWIKLL